MNKIKRIDNLMILTLGGISASAGIYGAFLEVTGEYEKMGLLFFPWLLLQTPTNFLALLILPMCNGSIMIYYFLTLIWWLLLGCFFGFIFVFLRNYFQSIYVE